MGYENRIKRNEYAAQAVKYKKQMNELIDVAYRDHPLVKQYKRFAVTCIVKEYATRLGDCAFDRDDKTSTIRLMNIEGRSWENILITLIHECSHHIDFSNRNQSGHDQPFYEIFLRLLFASFDMGILTEQRLLDFEKSESRNKEKLAGLVLKYRQHMHGEEGSIYLVFVKGGYDAKDRLKEAGYKWETASACWVKEIHKNQIEEERKALEELGLTDKTKFFCKMYQKQTIDYKAGYVTIYIKGAFDVRDKIKARQFTWNAIGKLWEKEVKEAELQNELSYLSSLGLKDEVTYAASGAVKSRLSHMVKVYNVTKEYAHIPKDLGYRWNPKLATWEKAVDEEEIPPEDLLALKQIPWVRIKAI